MSVPKVFTSCTVDTKYLSTRYRYLLMIFLHQEKARRSLTYLHVVPLVDQLSAHILVSNKGLGTAESSLLNNK